MSASRGSLRRSASGFLGPGDAPSHVLRRTNYGSESLVEACGRIRIRTSLTNFIQAEPPDVRALVAKLAKIHHPTLARYHDCGSGPGPHAVWFSADSFLPGARSLQSYIAAPQELSLTDKCVIALGMAIGLQVLHSEGVIHGDFVPSTVIIETVTSDSHSHVEPHLAGYGLCELKSIRGKLVDDLLYFAPELLQEGQCSWQTDMFAFGIVLWRLFSPRSADTVNRLQISGVIRGVELDVITDGLPPFLGTLIRSCCSGDPAERPSSKKAASYVRRRLSNLNIDKDRISQYLARLDGFVEHAELRGRAEAGDFSAMYEYAGLCLAGDVAPTTTANAASFFEQAAQGGLAKAQFRYGSLLYQGRLGPREVKRGRMFLDKAAEQQDEQALQFFKENPEPSSRASGSGNTYRKSEVIALARSLQIEVLELVNPEKYQNVLKDVGRALATRATREVLVSVCLDIMIVRPRIIQLTAQLLEELAGMDGMIMGVTFGRLQ
jgi:hypothetical protein